MKRKPRNAFTDLTFSNGALGTTPAIIDNVEKSGLTSLRRPCDNTYRTGPQLENAALLSFLREQGTQARYATSVCSGALLLGAAGLLRGYRATTHWMSMDLLSLFGAEPVEERVVVDRNRITGGGVTAGIDFGLVVAGELLGRSAAEEIQLALEYQPSPPYQSGLPGSAPAAVREAVLLRSKAALEQRRRVVERVASRLDA
jgi:cyclohexyl-isocyanide hydratase